MDFDQPPVVRVTADRGALDARDWPMTVPAVAQLVRDGLTLPKGVTFLVGGDWGLRPTRWEELELVQHWRRHLDDPRRYLRHVLD